MRSLFCILILLTGIFCKTQNFKSCIVYQFAGKATTKKHISLTQTFNQRGQVVSEIYSNYKSSLAIGIDDGTYHYYYTGTLLTKRLFIAYNKDTIKVLYYYNDHNQCIKEEYFTCEKRIRKDVKKGIGQPGGCIVFEEDFEKNRTWMKSNEVTYSYDDKGRKIKKTDGLDYTHFWQYDQLNRVIQEKAYSFDKVAYVQDYHYFTGGYRYSTIYYDGSGNPQPPRYSDIEFSPIFLSTFYVDKKDRIIKEETTTEKNAKVSTEITVYNSRDKVERTVYLNAKRQPEITHIFEYK